MLLKELGRLIIKGTSLLRVGEQMTFLFLFFCMNFYFSYDDDDDDRFYILLFSALEQTHCAFVGCDSK